jgi:hypothetical protein
VLLGLLALARVPVQLAEAEVAMGDERAHAARLGEGQRMLMRRVFDLDVLACPHCGGRLRVIATVQDPAVVRTILAHLSRANAPDPPGPAPPAPLALS